tara:strand:- start:515 stop:712 length:198 start_codon:yes stop_codon:yes gene_type:complete
MAFKYIDNVYCLVFKVQGFSRKRTTFVLFFFMKNFIVNEYYLYIQLVTKINKQQVVQDHNNTNLE